MSDRRARRLSTRMGIASAALAAGAGAAMVAPHGLLWTRAAIEGLLAGGRLASDAVLSLLGHPAATLRGATIAADHHVEGLKEWVEAGAAYATAWRVDPVSFITASFTLVGCAAACVIAAWGLERVTDRVALVLARAARDWTRHMRGSRRGPIVRLWRARVMRLEQRRGQRATGARAALQRIRWWARDLADGLRLLVTQPVPSDGAHRMPDDVDGRERGGQGIRRGCQQIAYLALPIVMLGVPWIDFSIHLDDVARAAERDIAPAASRYVDEGRGAEYGRSASAYPSRCVRGKPTPAAIDRADRESRYRACPRPARPQQRRRRRWSRQTHHRLSD